MVAEWYQKLIAPDAMEEKVIRLPVSFPRIATLIPNLKSIEDLCRNKSIELVTKLLSTQPTVMVSWIWSSDRQWTNFQYCIDLADVVVVDNYDYYDIGIKPEELFSAEIIELIKYAIQKRKSIIWLSENPAHIPAWIPVMFRPLSQHGKAESGEGGTANGINASCLHRFSVYPGVDYGNKSCQFEFFEVCRLCKLIRPMLSRAEELENYNNTKANHRHKWKYFGHGESGGYVRCEMCDVTEAAQ